MPNAPRLEIKHIDTDHTVDKLDELDQKAASPITITNYWSGEKAPEHRQFTAMLLWSDAALYVRFDASQMEPLVVNDIPELKNKAIGLWERDVCEIFIAPDPFKRKEYYEFEIAPTGEWIDLAIRIENGERKTNWDYASGMASAARVETGRVTMTIKIPFASLGRAPQKGDIWLGNLFRCVGKDPTRGYLAWQPTNTDKPNFHVPERFGEFHFVK